MASFDPTLLGAIRRFKRVVILAAVVGLVGAGVYALVSGNQYTATAGIIIAPLPANISPATSGSSSGGGSANYTAIQIAVLTSQSLSNQAAAIVNAQLPNEHLTGQALHKNLVVTAPTTSAKSTSSGSTGSMTQIAVSLKGAKAARAAANAILAAYDIQLKQQIHQQAATSEKAFADEIAAANAQLNGVPPPPTHGGGGTTHTTTPKPPHTTTTHLHHAPTTHVHHAPTTHATTTTVPTSALGARGSAGSLTAVVLAPQAGAPIHAQLASFDVLAATTTPTSTTSGTSGSGGESPTVTAQRNALLQQIASLTKSESTVRVNEQIDLAYTPPTQPATQETTKSGTSLLIDLGLGLLVGFILGVIIAYVLAATRRRFEGIDDPERLYEAPLLFAVPAFESSFGTRPGLPIITDPGSQQAESYRAVATALRSIRNSSASLLVAFTAADQGAGTTTTVANTALALAEMGERVLVIDSDPIGRGLTHLLADPTKASNGLAAVLSGKSLADSVVPANAGEGRLALLPTSSDTDLAMHRWRPRTMRSAFEEAAERFEMVLVDDPPVGSSSYGLDVAAAAEHVIIVVPHHDTVQKHNEIPSRLAVAGVRLLGYVYNGVPASPHFVPYVPVLYTNGSAPRPQQPAVPGTGRPAQVGGPPTIPVPQVGQAQVPQPAPGAAPPDKQPATGAPPAKQPSTVQAPAPPSPPAANPGPAPAPPKGDGAGNPPKT